MVQLSVVIITLNEEKKLANCLASIKYIADEIIVVDSNSSDNTSAIAASFGAHVIQQPFMGFVKQKQFATGLATHNWVLSIDADEVLSPELEQSIIQLKKADEQEHCAYWISRITNYCGKWIKHSGWYPDKIVRLIDKTKGEWVGENIHEHWQLQDATGSVGYMTGNMMHYSYDSISDHIQQIDKFSEISAKTAVANGKDASLFKIWLSPKWAFFSGFILKLGFLDGYSGYLVCKYSAMANLAKYSKIRQYAAWKRAGRKID